MKRFKLFASVIIAAMIVMLNMPALILAAQSPESEDNSFAAEGAHAYDNLKKNIEQSTLDGYDKLVNGTTGETDNILGGVDYAKKIWVTLFYILDVLSSIYKFVMVTSISIGVLVYLLARRNKKIRKFALYFLIIALPVIITLFRYGIPYIYTGVVG